MKKLLSLSFCLLFGCTPSSPELSLEGAAAEIFSADSTEGLAGGESQYVKLDPMEAKVKLISLTAEPLEGTQVATDAEILKFPFIKVEFDKANFVKVLRCRSDKSGFFVDTHQKQTFEQFAASVPYASPMGSLRYQTYWNQAHRFDVSGCVSMGTHVVRERIFDLAAPTGQWYYLLNPCVAQSFSSTGKEECSARLVKTKVMDFTSDVNAAVLSQAQKITNLEHRTLALSERMYVLTTQIAGETEYCETQAAIDAHNASIDQGWKKIIGGVAGAVLGFALSPFLGPTAIRHGLKVGMEVFSDGKTAMERYIQRLDCKKAEALLERFGQYEQDLVNLALEAKELRDSMATYHNGLAIRNQEISNAYNEMASCQCVPTSF